MYQYYGDGYLRVAIPGSRSELYISVWFRPQHSYNQNGCARIQVVLIDGKVIYVRLNYTHWDAYVDGVLVGTGSVILQAEWHNVQFHLLVADAGTLQVKVEGILDIDYSGDTKPGTSVVIDSVCLRMTGPGGSPSDHDRWDDFVVGYGGWPGDIWVDAIYPDGDDAVQWSRSAGAVNYALVDEDPPSDADYVYTITNTHKDVYTLEDWDGAGKTPLFVVQWCRAKKDSAGSQQVELVMDDGTEDIGAAQNILTSYRYVNRLMMNPPSGGAWSEAIIDALKVGQRAVI